jgi:hypothetical protein
MKTITLTAEVLDTPWALPRTLDITTLDNEGTRTMLMEAAPGDYIECITWHDARKPARPDADITVLLMTTDPDNPMQLGWWDADSWCLCESGGFAPAGLVVAWAEVEGPELP